MNYVQPSNFNQLQIYNDMTENKPRYLTKKPDSQAIEHHIWDIQDTPTVTCDSLKTVPYLILPLISKSGTGNCAICGPRNVWVNCR